MLSTVQQVVAKRGDDGQTGFQWTLTHSLTCSLTRHNKLGLSRAGKEGGERHWGRKEMMMLSGWPTTITTTAH